MLTTARRGNIFEEQKRSLSSKEAAHFRVNQHPPSSKSLSFRGVSPLSYSKVSTLAILKGKKRRYYSGLARLYLSAQFRVNSGTVSSKCAGTPSVRAAGCGECFRSVSSNIPVHYRIKPNHLEVKNQSPSRKKQLLWSKNNLVSSKLSGAIALILLGLSHSLISLKNTYKGDCMHAA